MSRASADTGQSTILFTNSVYRPHIGGIENSIHYLATTLQASGTRALVVCSDQGPDDRERLAARDEFDGIEVRRFPNVARWLTAFGLAPIPTLLRSWRFLSEIASTERIDAVVTRQQNIGLAASLAFPRIPIVYIASSISASLNHKDLRTPNPNALKDAILRCTQRYLQLPQLHWMQKTMLKRADLVLLFSESMRRQVLELVPEAGPRIRVRAPGVDTQRFAPAADKARLRRELGLPEDAVLGLGVGRLIRAKGYDRAIEALARIADEDRRLHLVFVGSGGELENLQSQAEALGVAERVHFAGASQNAERYYACADLYLMTSRYESFGQCLLEAASAELPIIAYRPTGDARVMTASDELVEHEVDGLLCELKGDGLADALRRFLGFSSAERERFGQAARAKVKEQHSWSAFAEFLLAEIRAL